MSTLLWIILLGIPPAIILYWAQKRFFRPDPRCASKIERAFDVASKLLPIILVYGAVIFAALPSARQFFVEVFTPKYYYNIGYITIGEYQDWNGYGGLTFYNPEFESNTDRVEAVLKLPNQIIVRSGNALTSTTARAELGGAPILAKPFASQTCMLIDSIALNPITQTAAYSPSLGKYVGVGTGTEVKLTDELKDRLGQSPTCWLCKTGNSWTDPDTEADPDKVRKDFNSIFKGKTCRTQNEKPEEGEFCRIVVYAKGAVLDC